ncbi:MAG: Long-chain fatty acid--CoA ligase [Mycobacterium sp.]|jgi:long-chain acyl-CoA synthetase|nr:Long-chain fatty acid--CoA ligase [Mycobacterium sp.]
MISRQPIDNDTQPRQRKDDALTNLSLILAESAQMYPEAIALRCANTTTRYAPLANQTAMLASYLGEIGIRPGDRVGMMLPNTAVFALIYYGILHAGAIVVPMNPLQSGREVEHFLSNTSARVLFAAPLDAAAAEGARAAGARYIAVDDSSVVSLIGGCAPRLHAASRSDDDTAVILHTSGTTGIPRGAELTNGNLLRNQAITALRLLHLGPDDVVMGCLPLFHAFGMTCGLNAAISTGATLALLPRFTAENALRTIATAKVTVFQGVPTMYSAMLAAAGGTESTGTNSLRVCISGGAALPVDVLHRFESRFGCVVLEGYGLSETSPVASFNHPDAQRKAGSIGTPIDGVQMRIVDDSGQPVQPGRTGEIQVRGHNVMKGYWGFPRATAAIVGGWFATGDIGRVDGDGYYFVVDRKKELILRGGYNVYPREIEEVLYQHPAVAEAVVVGIPHDTLGEEVGAAIVLEPGAKATVEQLQAFVRERVAAYKYPRRIWFVDELPKGPTGKLQRRSVHPPEQQEAPR